jgi:hypothetical protein
VRELSVVRSVAAAAAVAAAGITLWSADSPVVTAPGDQGLELDVVSDRASGAIVVWQDRGQSLVYVQRIDGNGQPLWQAPQRVAITQWEQFEPAAVEDGSGGAIVAWAEGRNGWCSAGFRAECDVYAQRFSASGERLWGESGMPVTQAPANQGASGISIASDGNGGAFLTWEDARPDCCKVYAQHINAEGSATWASDGIRLSPEPTVVFGSLVSPPQIVPDGEGGAIVAWFENQVDPIEDVPPMTVQRLDADGTIRWMENGSRVGAPIFTTFDLAGDGAGGAFVAFTAHTGSDFGEMSVQRVAPDNGAPLWGQNGVPVSATDYYALAPDLVADGNGGAIVAWVEHSYDEMTSSEWVDIFAQRVDTSGVPMWGAGGKPLCTRPGEQDNPRALSDGAGGAIVVWRDCRDYPNRIECFFGSDIYGQHVQSDGTTLWPVDGAPVSVAPGPQAVAQGTPTVESFIHMTTDMVGGAIVVWPDGRRGGCENAVYTTECDVFAQRINSTPPAPGCGDPTGDGDITATDALFTLNAAIGLATCELAYCDVDDSGAVAASDALAILNVAIGIPLELSCPSAGA